MDKPTTPGYYWAYYPPYRTYYGAKSGDKWSIIQVVEHGGELMEYIGYPYYYSSLDCYIEFRGPILLEHYSD